MSVKSEQYNSLMLVKEYLKNELDPQTRPKNHTERRKIILSCLRHFPFLKDDGEPIFSVH